MKPRVFDCEQCGRQIVTKFLKSGELAKCRLCGAENVVPDSAEVARESVYTDYASAHERYRESKPSRPAARFKCPGCGYTKC